MDADAQIVTIFHRENRENGAVIQLTQRKLKIEGIVPCMSITMKSTDEK